MSAYIVEREHIAYLIDAAERLASRQRSNFSWYHEGQRHELTDHETEAGQMLWDENVRSVNYRYADSLPSTRTHLGLDEQEVYKHHSKARLAIDPVQVLKSIRCLEYQSCETPDWEASSAHAFLRSLMLYAISNLAGYEDAMWGAPQV